MHRIISTPFRTTKIVFHFIDDVNDTPENGIKIPSRNFIWEVQGPFNSKMRHHNCVTPTIAAFAAVTTTAITHTIVTPAVVQHDRGREFYGELVTFLKKCNIENIASSPYHPQSVSIETWRQWWNWIFKAASKLFDQSNWNCKNRNLNTNPKKFSATTPHSLHFWDATRNLELKTHCLRKCDAKFNS